MSDPNKATQRGGQYLRVSIDRSGRSRSTDEQQNDNQRDATAQGIVLVESYLEQPGSASRYSTTTRSQYDRLLTDIAAGKLDIVYFWESSRGSRRPREWADLVDLAARHHVVFRITSHKRTYDPANIRDRRSLLEDAVDADFESGKISERVLRTVQASADAGRPGGALPFGYRRIYHPRTGTLQGQEADPETAPVVREIIARVCRGESLRSINADLNRREVPTPQMVRDRRQGRTGVKRGGWNSSKVRKLVMSPTIAGMRVHQGAVVGEATWPAIVSAADQATAVAILNDPSRVTSRGSAPQHLLSGIAQCGPCGALLRRSLNHGRPSYRCEKGCVTRALVPIDLVVGVVVVERLMNPDLLNEASQLQAGAAEKAGAAERELANLESRMGMLEVSLAEAVNAEAVAAVTRSINVVAGKIAVAKTQRAARSGLPQVVLDFAGPGAEDEWQKAKKAGDYETLRVLVRTLVRVVVYRSNQRRGDRGFDRSSVEVSKRAF